jgi:PPK2 family polyphosphate:nucleotide phosphotransferase
MPKLPSLRKELLVKPGAHLDLASFDTGATFGRTKDGATPLIERNAARLTALQDRLWAESKRRVLVVLQGIDASGKDGTIRHVMDSFNPMGCSVVGFKVPTPAELAHDFLWRVHAVVPGNGEIVIFNRSHYEDVLVVRVHGLATEERWRGRYAHINAFEKLLADEGTTILKFALFISRDEQRQRLQERVDDPTKVWKFKMGDLEERKRWDDYMAAYEEALARCSTAWAPWYAIPADRNWFRNLAVSEILADTLEELDPRYPPRAADVPSDLKIV